MLYPALVFHDRDAGFAVTLAKEGKRRSSGRTAPRLPNDLGACRPQLVPTDLAMSIRRLSGPPRLTTATPALRTTASPNVASSFFATLNIASGSYVQFCQEKYFRTHCNKGLPSPKTTPVGNGFAPVCADPHL